MNMHDYFTEIVRLLGNYDVWDIPPNTMDPEQNLWDCGLDSFSFVTLLVDIEEAFEITIDLSKVSKHDLSTIESIRQIIQMTRNEKHDISS
jgi:acyl carrier protein